MRIFIYLSFLLLLQKQAVIAQETPCACVSHERRFKQIEELFEQKEYEKISVFLDKIDVTKLSCRQRVLGYKLELYIALNKKDDIEIAYRELQQVVPEKSCDAVNLQYHYELGNYFFKIEKPDNAIDNFIIAKEIAEKLKDTVSQIRNINKIAFVFNKMQQPEKAIEYDYLGLLLAQKISNKKLILYTYSQMQAHFGVRYDVTGDYKYIDSIKKIASSTLLLAKQLNQRLPTSQTYSVLAGVAYLDKNYREALTLCDSGLLFLDRNKDFRNLLSIFTKKCDIHIELKNYKIAMQYADSAMKYAILEDNALSTAWVYERIYEIEKLEGNYSKALMYFERLTAIRDSIRSIEKTERINALEQKYNKVQNEKTIKELNQAREIASLRIKVLLAGVFLALLIILVIVIFYRQSVLKSKQENMEIEQRLNRARMNPHFFFNTLNSLQTFSMQENKESKVAQYLSKYAKIMRQTLESTYNEMTTVEDEIDYLTNYLDIQKLRHANKFEYTIHVDEIIEPQETYIPGMIIQPFIENSIEHGFDMNTRIGKIDVSFFIENKRLLVEIKDNGSGYTTDIKAKEYPSRAIQIIKDRLLLLNKKYKTHATFEITKGDEGIGIYIKIFLPLLNNESFNN